MKKILIVNPYFLPGYKSGGPQQTVQNICDVFGRFNDIYLVTQNRDYGDDVPYDYETDKWLKLYGINVMYVNPAKYNMQLFRILYDQFDIILTCGLFCLSSIEFMLIHTSKKKLYVAPMGVFSKNALAIRYFKKKIFLKFLSILGVFKKIIWSFTSDEELTEAKAAIGVQNIRDYIIAEDLPRSVDFQQSRKNVHIKNETFRVIFLSRIVPKKNLLYAIEILNQKYSGNIIFDIYGLKEDETYWRECKSAVENLPANVKCNYCGSIKPDESITTFAAYDVFLFPTQGENFGHVIYESLAAGCIPVISDTTPWKDFDAKKCGNIISLDNIQDFRRIIQFYIDTPIAYFMKLKMNAISYAEWKYKESVENSGYKSIFDSSLSRMVVDTSPQNN